MSKHTPGPWRVARDAENFRVAEVELFGIFSEHAEGGDARCGTPEADARLIAAAPDLLEALKAVMRWLPVYPQNAECIVGAHAAYDAAVLSARAAIAKATEAA